MKSLPLALIFAFTFASTFATAQTAPAKAAPVGRVQNAPAPRAPANSGARVARHPVRSLAVARGLNEIQFGALGAGSLRSEKVGGSNVTVLTAHGSFLKQMVRDEVQIGGEGAFYSSSGGGKSRNYIEVAGVGAWNFGRDMISSIYAKGGVGIFAVVNDKGEYENKFGFFAGGGKRFPLWSNVQFAPEVRVYKKGSADPSFEIAFINVSILF